MNNKGILIFTLLIILLTQGKAFSQNQDQKTKINNKSSVSVNDFAWLAGHWTGKGMGGYNEETWNPPVDNKMIGMYRYTKDGKVVFYELLTIMPNDSGEMVFRLKHFNPDLTGWEEKDQFQEFKLLRVEPGSIEFDGLSFQQIGDDSLSISVKFQQNDGSTTTQTFKLKKSSITESFRK